MKIQRERLPSIIITAVLLLLAISAGSLYSDDPKLENNSAAAEIKGIEKGQNIDGNTTSSYFMVELMNGSEFYYWKRMPEPAANCQSGGGSTGCEEILQEGYTEIKADLSYFRETEDIYLGQKYEPKRDICAEEITRTSIEILEC